MNGALTYKDLATLKRKAAVLDHVRGYLRERTVRDEDLGLQSLLAVVDGAYAEESVCKAGVACQVRPCSVNGSHSAGAISCLGGGVVASPC